jgi:CheY-like chemotaxis protein
VAGAARHVLVADDDLDIRALARLLLELAGHEVYEAGDGNTALETIEANPAIDVMLLDLRLPVRDGWQVMAELKARGHVDRGLRVVVFSAQIESWDHERAQREGATGYLPKPFSEADLLAAVDADPRTPA